MAFLHSVTELADLSRQFMRLNLLSRNFSSTKGHFSLFNSNITASSVLPSCSSQGHWNFQTPDLRVPARHIYTKRINSKEFRRKYKDDKDAIHCHGFTYYPRFPNHKDPPIEPAKLFMVKRIRSLFGCPWWEKDLMRTLKLLDRRTVGIFKNTPTVNSMLYRVKHLIQITPITMPQGLPDKPENGFLKQNGELVSYNLLSQHGSDNTVQDVEKQLQKYYEWNVSGVVVKHRMSTKWNSRADIV